MKTTRNLTIILICTICFAGQEPVAEHRLASSLQRKLDHIQQNAGSGQPDDTPTVMTEEEINDYFATRRVKLPQGVKRITFEGHSGVVTSFATIDFDEIRAGQRSSNPLLSLFNGTHSVRIEADAAGAGGVGKVHVLSVALDGTEIPRMALEFFVAKFLKPKYPRVGLDSEFQMPDKINVAVVSYHKLTITQK